MTRDKLLILPVALLAASAAADPFLTTDPLDTGVTLCGYSLDAGPRVDAPVGTLDGKTVCKVDLNGTAPGQHKATLTAIRVDATWGRIEGAPSPEYPFTVPTKPAPPANLRIIP